MILDPASSRVPLHKDAQNNLNRFSTAMPTRRVSLDIPSPVSWRGYNVKTVNGYGFRWSELRSRRRMDFALDGDKPLVYIDAGD